MYVDDFDEIDMRNDNLVLTLSLFWDNDFILVISCTTDRHKHAQKQERREYADHDKRNLIHMPHHTCFLRVGSPVSLLLLFSKNSGNSAADPKSPT